MIDHLLALRILFSATAIYFFVKTWRLCKHKGLLLLAAQHTVTTFTRVLLAFNVLETGSLIYSALLMLTCVFGTSGAYLIYSEFNKAYQEGRYAASSP